MSGYEFRTVFYRTLILPAAALALAFSVGDAHAADTPIPHGTLELIAEKQWIETGHSFSVALHLQLEKGWHVYWVNPGDSGEPPHVQWNLPSGITAGAVEWPAPRRLGTASIVDYGYEDAITLIVPMHVAGNLAATAPAQIAAEVKVLVCREMCIPGKAQVSLTLPVKPQPPPADEQNDHLFTEARKALPQPAPVNWKFAVAATNDSFVLTAHVGHQITEATFFPLAESQVSNAAPQNLAPTATGFRMTLRKSDQLLKPIARLKGVLVLTDGRAYSIDLPVAKPVAASAKGPA